MRILASLIAVASLVWLARPAPAAGIPGPGGGPAADSGGLPALLPIRSQVVSDTLETPPAPLLVPGRPGPGDSLGPNRPGRAHEQYRLGRSLELPPPRADKHRDLGAVLAARGKEREAREQYQRAIALDSHDPTSWVNLGNLERRGGRLERALDDYREAERRDSSLALALQGEI